MHRNKQIGIELLRHFGAFSQRNKDVIGTHQLGLVAFLRVDTLGQQLGNLQRNDLLFLALGAYRTGVFATVASINDHQQVPVALGYRAFGGAWGDDR